MSFESLHFALLQYALEKFLHFALIFSLQFALLHVLPIIAFCGVTGDNSNKNNCGDHSISNLQFNRR